MIEKPKYFEEKKIECMILTHFVFFGAYTKNLWNCYEYRECMLFCSTCLRGVWTLKIVWHTEPFREKLKHNSLCISTRKLVKSVEGSMNCCEVKNDFNMRVFERNPIKLDAINNLCLYLCVYANGVVVATLLPEHLVWRELLPLGQTQPNTN